uniref:hypothetical protein n=1 Tax=uncultured Aquimonas sp. TaxID=385483 RepID=UPI00262A7E17
LLDGCLTFHRVQEPGGKTLRDNIYRELLKRASYAASPMSRGCSLPPFSPLPHSAAGQLFAQYMIRLGEAFWTKPPTVSTISKVGG